MTDGNITETDTLVIPKGTVNGSLFISPTVSGTHTTSFPSGQSTDMILFCSLTLSSDPFINTQFIINDGINDHNVTLSNTTYTVTSQIVNFKNTNLTPGTYIATITFNGNDNFNSYKTSLMYTVTADGTLTLTPSFDFLDSSHTSTTLTATYINGNNQPISGANIDITTNDITVGTAPHNEPTSLTTYDKKITNSDGIATFTVNSVGSWRAYHKTDNTIYAVSNESNIRGVVAESNSHVPDHITLESDKNILSYKDSEYAHLSATIYDQHGDKIKNKIINFYIITEDEYISDINLVNDELVLTTIKASSVNNTELVTDITLTNGELVITKSIFANSQNIESALVNINFE